MRAAPLALAAALASSAALAQPVDPPPTTPSPVPSDDDDAARKTQAKERFERALELFKAEAWDAALAEFAASRALYPTKNATFNAAVCLKKLGRWDESLAMYEAYLRDFSNLAEADKKDAASAILELGKKVGTIDIRDSETGAILGIDGRPRGEFPSPVPVRVPIGTHTIHVYKAGFEPFDAVVEVAGGQTLTLRAPLAPLGASGLLQVTEARGRELDVLVDGAPVGTTPWSGLVRIGPHAVVLRGKGAVGTEPSTITVTSERNAALSLEAVELTAGLRVTPTPHDASVVIDAVEVGAGIFDGKLLPKRHTIEVYKDGFLHETREIELVAGKDTTVEVALERDRSAAAWRRPNRFVFGVDGAFGLAPSFGGDVSARCDATCSGGPAPGFFGLARVGYELGLGVGFEIGVGAIVLHQGLEDDAASLRPVGLDERSGRASDDLLLRGAVFLGGLGYGIRFGEGERAAVRFGVMGGAVVGAVSDRRVASFEVDGAAYGNDALVDTGLVSAAIAPVVRVGYEVSKGLELTGDVFGLFLVNGSPPTWDASKEIDAGPDGYATYPADTLTGGFMFVIAPGIGLRYEL